MTFASQQSESRLGGPSPCTARASVKYLCRSQSMDSFTMLSRAINPLLLRTTSSQPRQHGIKAASTVKVDLGTDFLCEVCREIDLKKLLTRPHLNEQDFLRSRGGEPQDYLEAVFWDLRETRESTHCLLCQFLFLAMSIHKKPDLEKGQTIIVWPHPIAEYRCYPPFGFWDAILQWAGEKFRLPCYWRGTTQEPFTRIPKTIGWQLHIATESHSSQAGPNVIEAADEQADVTQVAQANQVTSNESKYRQIQKSYPNQLRDSTGYELHDSSERSKKLSYPTCARDIFHLRSGLDLIFACHPANAELSSICIQLQGRKSTGPLDGQYINPISKVLKSNVLSHFTCLRNGEYNEMPRNQRRLCESCFSLSMATILLEFPFPVLRALEMDRFSIFSFQIEGH